MTKFRDFGKKRFQPGPDDRFRRGPALHGCGIAQRVPQHRFHSSVAHRQPGERARLNALGALVETAACRRKLLLAHFGDDAPDNCGNCDNCLNPPAAVAWNLDERYLRDLEEDGLPTARDSPVTQLSLVFLGGEQSHAWPLEAEFEAWDVGHAALTSAAERAGIGTQELLYARVDLAGDRLAGIDLVAPVLGWRRLDPPTRDLAQGRFADAVASACERLGLGPLSHRRP